MSRSLLSVAHSSDNQRNKALIEEFCIAHHIPINRREDEETHQLFVPNNLDLLTVLLSCVNVNAIRVSIAFLLFL